MRISVKLFFSTLFVSLVVVFSYIAYSYVAQLEVPLWILQYTFYAFMTAILGFIFLGILAPLVRDRLETGRMKKIRKLESLEALKNEYSRCQWSIANNLSEYVEKNKTTGFTAQLFSTIEMGEMRVSEKLQREVQEYNEKLRDYNIFQKASETYIRNTMERAIGRMFSKTLQKGSELHIILCSDFFMARYFNGETVTCNWLRDNEPIMLKNINRDVEESERYELDVLFNEVNNEFQKEEILLRFRKQKEAMKEHGNKIKASLQNEISSIEKQLQKYDYLKAGKKPER